MNISKRKLRSRLMTIVISMLCCVAVMSVGVYAASKQFSVSVANEVDVSAIGVDGFLWAKRSGNVVYNGAENSDEEYDNQKNATVDYLKLYDYLDKDNETYANNILEIEKQVNFELSKDNVDKDGNLKIQYVFKFELESTSNLDVDVYLTDRSTIFAEGDMRAEKVKLSYRYMFSATEPKWSENNTLGTLLDNNATNEIYMDIGLENSSAASSLEHYKRVNRADANTYTLFILAELLVPTTSTLTDAFTLGVQDSYIWAFDLKITTASF